MSICSVCKKKIEDTVVPVVVQEQVVPVTVEVDDKPLPKKKSITLENDLSNWGIKSPSKRISFNQKHLKVDIPKGEYSASGGVNEKFVPRGLVPSNSVQLEYQLRIPDDFQFQKGGKIGLGFNINSGCGGKDWKMDKNRQKSASYRLMFRKKGQIVGYVYLATDQGAYKQDDLNCPLLKNQGKEFIEAIGHKAPGAGLDVFRHTKKKLFLRPGKWNDIKMGATLNSRPNSNDGSLFLEVNGTRLETGGICWTANPKDNLFSQLQMPMWMGGSNKSWAASKDQWVKLRKITYSWN
jgi:hypothetical protein